MIILDTHIWLRWLSVDEPLPATLVKKIEQAPDLSVSAISCWEVAYLAKRGRVELSLPIKEWLHAALELSGVTMLPIDTEIARIAAGLPDHHRDPADRFIIASALHHKAKIISFDTQFPAYTELKHLLLVK